MSNVRTGSTRPCWDCGVRYGMHAPECQYSVKRCPHGHEASKCVECRLLAFEKRIAALEAKEQRR